jgi:hypothetical protein
MVPGIFGLYSEDYSDGSPAYLTATIDDLWNKCFVEDVFDAVSSQKLDLGSAKKKRKK